MKGDRLFTIAEQLATLAMVVVLALILVIQVFGCFWCHWLVTAIANTPIPYIPW